jgi:ankyrin repeat protein
MQDLTFDEPKQAEAAQPAPAKTVETEIYESAPPHLSVGTKPNVHNKDSNGKTPLHKAVETNNAKLIDNLIKAGTDADIKDLNGIPYSMPPRIYAKMVK